MTSKILTTIFGLLVGLFLISVASTELESQTDQIIAQLFILIGIGGHIFKTWRA